MVTLAAGASVAIAPPSPPVPAVPPSAAVPMPPEFGTGAAGTSLVPVPAVAGGVVLDQRALDHERSARRHRAAVATQATVTAAGEIVGTADAAEPAEDAVPRGVTAQDHIFERQRPGFVHDRAAVKTTVAGLALGVADAAAVDGVCPGRPGGPSSPWPPVTVRPRMVAVATPGRMLNTRSIPLPSITVAVRPAPLMVRSAVMSRSPTALALSPPSPCSL